MTQVEKLTADLADMREEPVDIEHQRDEIASIALELARRLDSCLAATQGVWATADEIREAIRSVVEADPAPHDRNGKRYPVSVAHWAIKGEGK